MNIIIPMSGRGKRFNDAGYQFPKPLLPIFGKPMIQFVVENLDIDARYIFICRKDHYEKFSLKNILKSISPGCEIILTDGITDGAASSVLLAENLINNDEELIIANSDQWVDWMSSHFLKFMKRKNADGGMLTFLSTSDKWSYVKLNDDGSITEVAEKKPISNIATVGVYYFKHGLDFVNSATKMIRKNIRVNNEFYVAPVYNEMIDEGKKIYPYHVAEMHGLGTPEDLNDFLESDIGLSLKNNSTGK